MDPKFATQTAQLEQMLAVSRTSIIASALLALALAYMQREVIPPQIVAPWLCLLLLLTLFRAALVYTYQKHPTDSPVATHKRLLLLRIGILITGLVWGSAGILLFPPHDPQHQMFLVYMLAGLTAGGVVSYSADLISAIGFSASTLTPLTIGMLGAGDELSIVMGMSALLYLGFMIVAIRYINKNVTDNILLRIEAMEQERIVRTSEERYRALIENSPLCVHEIDLEGRFLSMNQAGLKMLGQDDDSKVCGIPFQSVVSQQDGGRINALFQQALDGTPANFEFTTAGETPLTFKSCFIPIKDGGGKVMKLMGLTEDISERKQAERQLRVAASAFESQEGMLITDANNDILRVNKAFTTITGYTAEEVIGKNPGMLSSGRQDKQFYAAMWQSLSELGNWDGEIWNRRKNGEVYPEHLIISVVKDLDGNITNYVASLADITQRKKAEEEIRNLAFYDALTGMPNRRLLMDRLQQALAFSARSGHHGAILFIDLDNFKALNDTLGHDIGDILLQQAAERLAACTRNGDTVARMGGDEFVVLLENLSRQSAEAAAQTEAIGEKIIANLNLPYQLAEHEYHNTPSIGATVFSNHERKIDELFKQADIAMYQAKKAGRNALRFFDPEMQRTINIRAALEGDLRKALDNHQLRLYYQIQVDATRHTLGAEALIRWVHPERGMVSPAQFIPLAEETSLILPIGQWVLETACAQLKTWQHDELTRDLVLAVNVSAVQFRHADFVSQVQNAVLRHAIAPSLLKLELTESMLFENIGEIITRMNALKEIGVQISLDDFGTGYSSLQYLKKLPLDQLKIDQSFVRDLDTDSSDKAIVTTIIAMAHSLGLDAIAEGVETEAQRQLLIQLGCTHHQGYLFGKPVQIEDFMLSLYGKASSTTNTYDI
jgi:diguanylate cyclase (GGDEF)-like protein/PAS domain S-box-containing protein